VNNDELAAHLRHLAYLAHQSHRLRQEEFVARLLGGPRYADPRRLARHEHQVYSQNGEDGVLQEVFRRIGAGPRTFLEVGAGGGLENNTAFLLSLGWAGVWVEGDPRNAQAIRQVFARQLASGALGLVAKEVTAEDVGAALAQACVPAELGLLSLDVDQNTYWLWRALGHLRPRVVVVEYNASLPAGVDWKVAYEPARRWDGTLYFGASLKAYERLGAELGYRLVGCELTGTNAFFVREDLCGGHFVSPFDAETHYEPPRHFLVGNRGHPRGPGAFA
jgi:hypothetical protein